MVSCERAANPMTRVMGGVIGFTTIFADIVGSIIEGTMDTPMPAP